MLGSEVLQEEAALIVQRGFRLLSKIGFSFVAVAHKVRFRYLLKVERETDLFISLQQQDRRNTGRHDRYPVGIGFDLRRDDDIADDLPCLLNADKGLVLSMDYFKGREIAKCITVKRKQKTVNQLFKYFFFLASRSNLGAIGSFLLCMSPDKMLAFTWQCFRIGPSS